MIGNCPKCGSASWSPAQGCRNCGYNPTYMVQTPTSYQRSKFLKHGFTLVSSGVYFPHTAWNPNADPNVSHFDPSLDLVQSIQWVASSGSPVVPCPGWHGGKVSLIAYFGFTTGKGVFEGQPKSFQAVRLVNTKDPTLVHMFPDEIQPGADLLVVCRGCGRKHPAPTLPQHCTCGWHFHN